MLCDSGQCLGLPHQMRLKIKLIPLADSTNWCSLCIMKAEEEELFIEHSASATMFIVKPKTGYNNLFKMSANISPDLLDQKLFEFISRKMNNSLSLPPESLLSEDGHLFFKVDSWEYLISPRWIVHNECNRS